MAICILHLDGDSGFSASVKSLLESEGMEIILTLVRSEHEFREALAADAFDLILAEYSLPDFDGVSALKEARRRKPRVPFFFLSATPGDEAAAESLRLGADGYLAKSDSRRLAEAVDRVARASRDRMQSPAPIPNAGFRGLRILVAEDNTVNQVVVASLLEALGCDAPDVVGDGRRAMTAFRGKAFDIIFMDCQMPELDGYAATARIRRMEARVEAKGGANRRCYIAAVTADILPDVEERCRAAGMDGQLTKPYIIEDLVATLVRARDRAAAGGFQAVPPSRRPYGGDSGAGGTDEKGDLDNRILERLRRVGEKESPSVFRDLVRGFLDKEPGKLNAIGELARTREHRALAFAAHGLKGLCLNFGALSMARECEALQVAAEGEMPTGLPGILKRLTDAEARTRALLEGMIGTEAAEAGAACPAPTEADSDG